MKGLFVNKPKSNLPDERSLKSFNSKELKSRRYNQFFYRHNVIELYTWLNFFSVKFDFDIKILLELLLENLYNEAKIDELVYQMSRMEEDEEHSSFYGVLLTIALKQYMDAKNVSPNIRNCVLKDLNLLMEMNAVLVLLNHSTWKLEFLHVKNGKIKFYNNEMVAAKKEKILKEMFFDGMEHVFVDFLNYIKDTLVLRDMDMNKQIEDILSRYYLLYRNKMVRIRLNK